MRSFEVLVVVVNILLMGWILFAKNKSQRGLLIGFGLSAIVLLMHGGVEGMRWQMMPAYAMTGVPLAIVIVSSRMMSRSEGQSVKKASNAKHIALTMLAVIYSSVAVTLPLILPVFTFDKPTGPYKIGTVTYDWKDDQREETLTPEPGDKRELMVQIWYPADSTAKGSLAPYISDSDVFAEGYSKILNLPKLLFTTFGFVKTHSIEHAEISNQEASYPVLLFSHGFSGHKNQNTFQIEQLVSHGYIVVGIDHTYSSTASVFSDGRVANYMPQDTNSIAYLDKANEGWVEDAAFVLDQVEKLTKDDPDHRFTGRLDMKNVAMFGHSFGGATSTQMLMTDSRIKAALNMDGILYGKLRVPADGLKKPFLMMNADDTLAGTANMSGEDDAAQREAREELAKFYSETLPRYEHVADGGNYWMKIKNMRHMGFSDLYLFSPLYEKMEGVDIRKAYRLINDYSLDFFDHYLKQQPFKLLEQNIGDYPAFTLQKG
ncbi:acetylhydrolase [Paenibacillus sp. ACRRX]|uniref:alpha/beta hydrolase family protein n=1 Tax=unclassified Paenibacillus TaxID=185978 RepID=UPI001EF496A2|nr:MULTISPECIES: acetylhydrolase [unclassified Paenibacillus]MCG7408300.1 acetylhydrolase [Paenibacillus sp. ACRRX]MDK8181315.1 acetylhydrolase [Paenibacillus sp. UMB4589-SE434]